MGATSGFFVFDYNVMDCSYGQQAFSAISAALHGSRGTCGFCDGDVSQDIARQLVQQAKEVIPAAANSPLVDDATPSFGPYLAAMWTDTEANFSKIHEHLCGSETPGYLGYLTLRGAATYQEFAITVGNQLYLPSGIIFTDGSVLPETAKYGIL